MTIKCSKCDTTDEIFCGACSPAEIKKSCLTLGWHYGFEHKITCPECMGKERGIIPKSFEHMGQKYIMK